MARRDMLGLAILGLGGLLYLAGRGRGFGLLSPAPSPSPIPAWVRATAEALGLEAFPTPAPGQNLQSVGYVPDPVDPARPGVYNLAVVGTSLTATVVVPAEGGNRTISVGVSLITRDPEHDPTEGLRIALADAKQRLAESTPGTDAYYNNLALMWALEKALGLGLTQPAQVPASATVPVTPATSEPATEGSAPYDGAVIDPGGGTGSGPAQMTPLQEILGGETASAGDGAGAFVTEIQATPGWAGPEPTPATTGPSIWETTEPTVTKAEPGMGPHDVVVTTTKAEPGMGPHDVVVTTTPEPQATPGWAGGEETPPPPPAEQITPTTEIFGSEPTEPAGSPAPYIGGKPPMAWAKIVKLE